MPANTAPIFPASINNSTTSFSDVDGTNLKQISTTSANGTRVDAIIVTSTDTVDRDLNLYINDGISDFQIGQVTIPAGSGTTTSASVSALNILDLPWLENIGSLFLKTGFSLKAGMATNITTSKVINVIVIGGDY